MSDVRESAPRDDAMPHAEGDPAGRVDSTVAAAGSELSSDVGMSQVLADRRASLERLVAGGVEPFAYAGATPGGIVFNG